ncbi:MAG TPA: wax ester/triacylglycerol synthase family O-acyltransferase [Candidatus Dormibacteraeota bacterium]|nr:wax ester/triacylglycerol synthase family O-acyltransferase [Candidatus Dormibacteraeota bacterium]
MSAAERTTAVEASFLALEREGLSMHVAGVVLLAGGRPVTLRDLKHLVATRVRRLPRFGQRAHTPFGGRSSSWVQVARIDYGAHLFHHELPAPGRASQLHELCARIHEQPLDRDRPLWEMHLIDGLAGGAQALVIKTHHAITDGLAGMEIAEVMFDPAAGKPRPHVPATRFVEPCLPSPLTVLQGLVGLAFTAAGGPIAVDGPFNGPVGPHRTFATATLRMDALRRLKRELGGSIDDVVVAIVAAGIGRYLREVGYPELPTALRAMLPVSTRPPARGVHLGNHVSAVFIDLPTDAEDVPALVRSVAASKATLRTAHAAAGGAMLVSAAGLLPAPVHRAILRLVSDTQFANLVLSDVPGPADQLYLLGRRVVACYPMMPLGGHVGLAVAAVSMGGTMGIGITADPGLVPEPQRLASAIERVLPSLAGETSRRAA